MFEELTEKHVWNFAPYPGQLLFLFHGPIVSKVSAVTGVTLPAYPTVFLTDSLRILGQAHPHILYGEGNLGKI